MLSTKVSCWPLYSFLIRWRLIVAKFNHWSFQKPIGFTQVFCSIGSINTRDQYNTIVTPFLPPIYFWYVAWNDKNSPVQERVQTGYLCNHRRLKKSLPFERSLLGLNWSLILGSNCIVTTLTSCLNRMSMSAAAILNHPSGCTCCPDFSILNTISTSMEICSGLTFILAQHALRDNLGNKKTPPPPPLNISLSLSPLFDFFFQ